MFEIGQEVRLKIAHTVWDDETYKDIEHYPQGSVGELIAIEDGYYMVKIDNGVCKTRRFYLEAIANA